MIKKIIKENIELKNQLSEIRTKEGQFTERSVGKLDIASRQFLDVSNEKMNITIVEELNFTKKNSLNLPKPPNPVKKYLSA